MMKIEDPQGHSIKQIDNFFESKTTSCKISIFFFFFFFFGGGVFHLRHGDGQIFGRFQWERFRMFLKLTTCAFLDNENKRVLTG